MDQPINSEADMEPFKEVIERLHTAMKVKEPASNYDMPIRYRKLAEEKAIKEAEAVKIKAAEEAATALKSAEKQAQKGKEKSTDNAGEKTEP